MEKIITYETLYTILRQEKYKPELQKLDPKFFHNVLSYLKDKNNILSSLQGKSDNLFAAEEIKKTKKQIENCIRVIKELYEKRESKIISLALMSSRINEEQKANVTSEEREMLLSVKESLDYYRENILKSLLDGKMPELLEKPKALKREKEKELGKDNDAVVEFLESVPSFLGKTQECLGPFEKGEKANLPQEIAHLFIRLGKAKNENTKED